MARRLKTIARWINDSLPELHARIERGYCNTDRKIPGSRLRRPGLGRWGNRLIVTRRNNKIVVYDHNGAETYRTNDEVERWLTAWVAGKCTDARCLYATEHDPRCRLVGRKKKAGRR